MGNVTIREDDLKNFVWVDGLAFTDATGELPGTPIDLEELEENAVPYFDFGLLDDTGAVVGRGTAYLTPEGMDMAAEQDMWPEDLLARLADEYQEQYTRSYGMDKIRVMYKRVGETPEVGWMENTYEALKAYFNQGMLKAVPFCGTTMYLDERGKFKNLEPNCNVVFTNMADDGNEVDLTDEQIHKLNMYFEIVGWYKEGGRWGF